MEAVEREVGYGGVELMLGEGSEAFSSGPLSFVYTHC